jgi:hypothetical protein
VIYRQDRDRRFSGHVVEIYNVGGSPDQELNPSEFVIHREIGKSRVPGICVLCHRKYRNPDGRLYGGGHMVSGHMGHCIAQGASQCRGALRVQGTCAS